MNGVTMKPSELTRLIGRCRKGRRGVVFVFPNTTVGQSYIREPVITVFFEETS